MRCPPTIAFASGPRRPARCLLQLICCQVTEMIPLTATLREIQPSPVSSSTRAEASMLAYFRHVEESSPGLFKTLQDVIYGSLIRRRARSSSRLRAVAKSARTPRRSSRRVSPGLPLRNLLRNGLIRRQSQAPNHRWFIDRQ